MFELFEITAGTIPGRRHVGIGNLLVGKNNQDAYGLVIEANTAVLTVFDGCSSGAHTEVGAKLASRIVPAVIARAYETQSKTPTDTTELRRLWSVIKTNIVDRLHVVATQLVLSGGADDWVELIRDYFTFTIFGAVITPSHTIIFSIGDGLYTVNGESRQIGPFPNNAPPYIGYALLPDVDVERSEFAIHEVLQTQTIETLVLGTDGIAELESKAGTRLPGKERNLCSLKDLSSDAFFAADQSLTCWLRQVNSEVVRLETSDEPCIKRDHGLLSDDTTLVIARRRR
jgi:hypothetical protein